MLDRYLIRLGLPGKDDKPLVGVSACLLGRPVRYNGENRRESLVADLLPELVQLREFCPEVGIGLPVPRPPIQVVQLGHRERVRGIADTDQDFTEALRAYAQAVPDLHGFVLKARSPSCGVGTTPLMNPRDGEIGLTSGIFARVLQQRFPLAPICDESQLTDLATLEMLALKTHLYRAWKAGPDRNQLTRWRTALAGLKLDRSLDAWLQRLEEASSWH